MQSDESGQATAAPRARYHHGDLRAQLIEATRALVESKGPDHFSVSEACRMAGVSTAAPYKHFKDKDEMLRAVARDGMARHKQMMEAAIAPLPPRSLARIEALGRLYVDFAREEQGVFRLMFGLSADHGQDESLMATGADTFGVVKREVAAFYGCDTVAPLHEYKAFQLWSFVHGLSFLQIDGKLEKMGAQLDLEAMLADIARRVMLDPA